jgi:hypothetical protein
MISNSWDINGVAAVNIKSLMVCQLIKKNSSNPGAIMPPRFTSGFQPLKHVMTGVFVQVHKRLQPLFCLGALNGARLMNFWRQLGQVSHKLN